jgi:hypothetical protein
MNGLRIVPGCSTLSTGKVAWAWFSWRQSVAVAEGKPASRRLRRTITSTANGCGRAFATLAPTRVSDYELLELVLFRAIPQRDIKPLAKELIAKFGSFA